MKIIELDPKTQIPSNIIFTKTFEDFKKANGLRTVGLIRTTAANDSKLTRTLYISRLISMAFDKDAFPALSEALKNKKLEYSSIFSKVSDSLTSLPPSYEVRTYVSLELGYTLAYTDMIPNAQTLTRFQEDLSQTITILEKLQSDYLWENVITPASLDELAAPYDNIIVSPTASDKTKIKLADFFKESAYQNLGLLMSTDEAGSFLFGKEAWYLLNHPDDSFFDMPIDFDADLTDPVSPVEA